MELQARDTELRNLKAKQHDTLTDLDAMHTMEHELKAQLRMLIERDEKTQTELERLIAENAKAEADRQSGERALRMARLDVDSSSTVRAQVEASLKDARGRLGQAEEELKRSRADREALQRDFDRARREWEDGRGASQKEREAERAELQQSREKLKALGGRMEAKESELRGAREQLQGALADVERARAHEREEVKRLLKANSEKEASLREDLAWAKDAAVQAESKLNLSEKAARKARWEADTAAQEAKWLEGELKRLAHSQI
jgi:chromosome segregation ATPase